MDPPASFQTDLHKGRLQFFQSPGCLLIYKTAVGQNGKREILPLCIKDIQQIRKIFPHKRFPPGHCDVAAESGNFFFPEIRQFPKLRQNMQQFPEFRFFPQVTVLIAVCAAQITAIRNMPLKKQTGGNTGIFRYLRKCRISAAYSFIRSRRILLRSRPRRRIPPRILLRSRRYRRWKCLHWQGGKH